MKIILVGYAGHMGIEVRNAVALNPNFKIACGIDPMLQDNDSLCVKTFEECTADADCIFDFSHHSLTKQLTDFAVSKNLPLIIATTGHNEEEKIFINAAAQKIPVFKAANFSLGIAAMNDLVKRAALLFPDADIEIVEQHHNRKIDAPSGTALSLFKAIQEVRPQANAVCGRVGLNKREKNDVGIHAIRMGNYVGVHEVIISTANETLTLRHQAFSRGVFADGAMKVAEFIINKPAGLYGMTDFLRR